MKRAAGRCLTVRSIGVIACFVLLVSVACTQVEEPGETLAPEQGSSPPNVLIILTDDQFQGTLEAMPRTRFWFEEHGTRLTNAIVSSPLCCPSRASILTGRYVHNHGVLRNNLGYTLDLQSTIQKYLQAAGYRTGIAGKLLQGVDPASDPPFWDTWATSLWGYYNATFNIDGKAGTIVEPYSVDFIRRRAQRFLRLAEKPDDRPWLLFLAPVAPHKPYQPADRYVGSDAPELRITPPFTEEDRSDKPGFVRRSRYPLAAGEGQRKKMIRTLMSVDDLVDQVFKTLGRLDERRDTLAFFLSDNGHLLGQHGLFAKRLPYRAAIEIPFLIRWPGHVPQNQTNDRLVSTIDILPSVLEAANIEPQEKFPLDGASLLSDSQREYVLIEQYGNEIKDLPDWSSIRNDSFQYTEYRRGDRVVLREYYDMKDDPWQLDNLLGDSDPGNDPDTEQLHAELEAARSCEGSSCP